MSSKLLRVALCAVVAATLFGPPVPARGAVAPKVATVRAYEGLGTWVDIYDRYPWRHPVAALRRMKARGVKTLFLQTSNYQRKRRLHRSKVIGRFLEAAHRRNMQVVAWYVPSFEHLKRDYGRVMAAVRFRSRRGERFDSFALDIEADEVRNVSVRNDRLMRLSMWLRRKVGRSYPLGAIIPDPIGSRFWPGFPYRSVARVYDVFVPMSYFTYRTHGYRGVLRHTRAGINRIRRRSGDRRVPIHVIGGEADDADRNEVKAFVRAVKKARTLGASLYDFAITRKRLWERLRVLTPRPVAPKGARLGKNRRTRGREAERSRPRRERRVTRRVEPVIPRLNRGLLVRRCVQAAGPAPCTLVSLGLDPGPLGPGRSATQPVE